MGKKPYVIAEAGVNFYDTACVENIPPFDAAKKYIKAAKDAGVDAVKFQSYKADTIASKNSPAYWDLLQEPTPTQHQLFLKFDNFSEQEYIALCAYCKELGVDFMSTPFDYISADYLEPLVDIYKISSSDLSNLPFIRYIAKKSKPIALSVGASYLSEVEEAVRAIKDEGGEIHCIMHCVLSYPTKYENANLRVINTLKHVFPGITIGYSDHTMPDSTMTVLSAAYLLGADVLEKHFTLDKTLLGNDHYHAGDPSDFRRATENFKLINTVLGSDEKTVYPCEETPRREARRSLVALRNIRAGEIICEKNLIAKRPGSGISPRHLDIVIGRAAKQDIAEDTILTWDML